MKVILCPSCKRKGTYSPKNKQCAACGLGYEVREARLLPDGAVVPVTPVTEPESDETHNVTSNGGRHCSTCTCGPPKTGAERQHEYRERKKGK